MNNSADANFHDSVKTPFTIGIGLHMQQQTRSKKVIKGKALLGLKLSIPCDKEIETLILQ